MAHGRWYPTTTVLGNGRVMTFSGLIETGGTDTAVEIYTPGAGWGPEFLRVGRRHFSAMHLLTNGNVFYAGIGRGSRIFNTVTKTWSAVLRTRSHFEPSPSARPCCCRCRRQTIIVLAS